MLINYNDISTLKALINGTLSAAEISWLNNKIAEVEQKHDEYIQKRNKLQEAVLTALDGTSKNWQYYHLCYYGKTADEIRQEVSKILNTEINLPMVTYALRTLVNDKKIIRHEGNKYIADRVNYYGKKYTPNVVFTLAAEKEN